MRRRMRMRRLGVYVRVTPRFPRASYGRHVPEYARMNVRDRTKNDLHLLAPGHLPSPQPQWAPAPLPPPSLRGPRNAYFSSAASISGGTAWSASDSCVLPPGSVVIAEWGSGTYSSSDESEEAVAVGDDDSEAAVPMPTGIKASVRKLRKVIRAVRSSPQRRQHWYQLLSPKKVIAGVHMLILDVKTRWSSTHQMMDRAVKYRDSVTKFISENPDLHGDDLTVQDRNAISLVSDWLSNLRSSTSQMSTTSRPMLSSTHAIFRGLQTTLKEKLVALPKESSPELVEGLSKAHRKLSDYYYKYNQSSLYIWATRAV
ncbi:hypothetical protein DFH09DRAFT_1311412 [Mycena vulgaris]|nr:hypothetical protein DFH09DRAFT_1311412 [Mycena vulgaris]